VELPRLECHGEEGGEMDLARCANHGSQRTLRLSFGFWLHRRLEGDLPDTARSRIIERTNPCQLPSNSRRFPPIPMVRVASSPVVIK
jgi:hypothetical protein